MKNEVYYHDGSLRDLYILTADRADWEKWIDYVNQNYTIQWYNTKTDREQSKIDFEVINEFWSNSELSTSTKVFTANIQISCHFFFDSEIENDIQPQEFNSIDDHNRLLKYMSDLASILHKDVILTPENQRNDVLIRVNYRSVGK